MPQNFHDPSFRLMALIAIGSKLHHYLCARNRPFGAFFRHENIRADLRIIRNHKAKILRLLVSTHKLFPFVLQNTDHRRLPPLSAAVRQRRNLHSVQMKGSHGMLRGNIKILRKPLHFHKAEALDVPDKNTYRPLAVRLHISALFVFVYSAFRKERPQHFPKLPPVFCTHLHKSRKFLFLHGHISFVSNQLAY